MNRNLIIFVKAGEEWTTIAKTKGKKKTKPEDEWQEGKLLMINYSLDTFLAAANMISLIGWERKERSEEKGVGGDRT